MEAGVGERCEAIFEVAADAIVTIDGLSRIVGFNRAAERLFRRDRAAVLGRDVATLLDWPADDTLQRAALTARCPSGEAVAIEATFATLGEGATRLRTAILRDDTQRLADLRLLREAKEAAEDAVRARSMALAHVGHELRGPLNALVNGAALLLDSPLAPRERELAEAVRTGAQAATAVAAALLDLTRLEAGTFDLDVGPTDVRRTVGDSLRLVAAAAQAHGLAIECHVAPDVPGQVAIDGGRLRQVLVNLLGNAVKFTPRGEVAVRVQAHATGDDGIELHFAVRDTGIGIAPGDVERLFRPFSQLEDGRRRGGTGLGLAISRRLCEMMGGRIWVDSTRGAGSTFHFIVRARSCEAHREAEPASRRLDVLVVDDDAMNRRIVAAMVERLGHRVRTAADAAQAVGACRDFDVVLMDVQMGGMDGIEAAGRITGAGGTRPRLVALTGHAGAGVRERLMEAGFDAYLAKPPEAGQLAGAIDPREAPKAPCAARQDEAIDGRHIESLRQIEPAGALLHEVVRHFMREAAPTLRALRAHAARGDRRGIEERSHRARSVALACGASRVARVCGEIEESGATGALWRVPVLVDRLQAEIDAACAALAPLAPA